MAWLEAEGAVHDESAWGQRAGKVLTFLFPARPSPLRFLPFRKKGDPDR
jgi:hypothetical protein